MKCRTGLIKGHAVDCQVPACFLRIPFKQQRHLKSASLDLSGRTDECSTSAGQYTLMQRQVSEGESIKIYPFPQLRTSAYFFTRHQVGPTGRLCAHQVWRISGSSEAKRSPARFWSGNVWRIRGSVVAGAAGVHAPPSLDRREPLDPERLLKPSEDPEAAN